MWLSSPDVEVLIFSTVTLLGKRSVERVQEPASVSTIWRSWGRRASRSRHQCVGDQATSSRLLVLQRYCIDKSSKDHSSPGRKPHEESQHPVCYLEVTWHIFSLKVSCQLVPAVVAMDDVGKNEQDDPLVVVLPFRCL